MNNDKLHVGIIMDGNRRYADKKGMPRLMGHSHGSRALEKLLLRLSEDDLGTKEITLYAFSMENFSRSKEEVDSIFSIFRRELSSMEKRVKNRSKARIRFLGRLDLFPDDIREMMDIIMKNNKEDYQYTINFLMAYNGQDEIVDAISSMIDEGEEEITRDTIKKHTYLNDSSDPDIIIRTGMEDGARLSGFMLWHSTYSELYFLKEYWPEFGHETLKSIIDDYNNRNRRFGR